MLQSKSATNLSKSSLSTTYRKIKGNGANLLTSSTYTWLRLRPHNTYIASCVTWWSDETPYAQLCMWLLIFLLFTTLRSRKYRARKYTYSFSLAALQLMDNSNYTACSPLTLILLPSRYVLTKLHITLYSQEQ